MQPLKETDWNSNNDFTIPHQVNNNYCKLILRGLLYSCFYEVLQNQIAPQIGKKGPLNL